MNRNRTNLSELAVAVVDDLRRQSPERAVTVHIQPDVYALADHGLLRVLFDNLFGNSWKFTGRTALPRIEFSVQTGETGPVYQVKDNGAGFDMTHMGRLFQPFQRLHLTTDFAGTGIGLATARRVVDHHGGAIWAEGALGEGATVFFTLPPPRGAD